MGLADDLTQVTLGHVDTDPEVLTGGGGSLRDAIGDRLIDDRIGDLAPQLPTSGWRLIHRSPAQPGWGGNESYAAPWGETADSGWAMASVAAPVGGGRVSILSAAPGPFHVFPGRAARRAALSLSWPDDLTASPGSIPVLSIRLDNTTNQVWTNQAGVTAHVRGWLLDADGQRLETSAWFAHGFGHALPTLQSGAAVMLPVDLASYSYESLRPGRYQLEAVAVALDLYSTAGSILLQ